MSCLHFDHALTGSGWQRDVRLTIGDGVIATLEIGVAARPGDSRHAIGLPGIPNLHSHAFQRGMAGLAETRGPGSDSFWSWREVMYRFALRMTPEDLEVVAAQAYVEMLEAGYTRVGEFHYLHHDQDGGSFADPAEMSARIAAAAAATGIGLTLLPVFYAHGGFGGGAPGPAQRRFIHDLDGYARLIAAAERVVATVPGARLGVAPHSLRAVTPAELCRVATMLPGRPVHIHIAEQRREVEESIAWSGAWPVAWLLDNEPVDERWCLVHATHMTEDETRRLAASGAVAGLAPITEANLGDGIFAGPGFVAAGGRYGVGSDSNVEIDAAAELRLLEYSQRLALRARNVMTEPGRSTAEAMVTAAVSGGGQALGETVTGLRVGASADIVSLKADHPALAGHGPASFLDAWVFNAGRALVDTVWVRGAVRVSGGRHPGREAIGRRFAQTMARLLST